MPTDQDTEPDREGPADGATEPPTAPRDAQDLRDDPPLKRKGGIPRVLLDEHAVTVVRRLQSYDHEAYLVGGCVRDLLSGLEPKDFDVATDARPNRIKRLFRNARIIGRRFRLAHIRFGPDHVVETSTFRGPPERAPSAPNSTRAHEESADHLLPADPESVPGPAARRYRSPHDRRSSRAARRAESARLSPENVFGTAPEDARRRDFTINALFYDPVRDEILDWVGGLEDLENGLVRAIGDPTTRVKEDPVRMIRAVHFAARMGFCLEATLEAAIRDQAEELANASQARLYIELLKVLGRASAYRSLHRLHELGVLRVWLPELVEHLETPAYWPKNAGGTHEEAREGEPRELPAAHATWNLLGAADRWGMAAHGGEDCLVLAPLLATWLLDVWRTAGERGYHAFVECFDETLRPLALRMSMPRRTTARLRDLLWIWLGLQQKPEGRRAAKLVRRPAFGPALTLLRLDLMARDRSLDLHRAWASFAERHGHGTESRAPRRQERRGPRDASRERDHEGSRRRRGTRSRRRDDRASNIRTEADAWKPAPDQDAPTTRGDG